MNNDWDEKKTVSRNPTLYQDSNLKDWIKEN